MAEGTSHLNSPEEVVEVKEKACENLECAVCLQPCIHPAELPCGHIFCFLCVKGIANQSKRCAMCRQEIPRDFIEQPKLLQCPETQESFDDGYQWFYEGRNGWWQYDSRTTEDLETAFQLDFSQIEILLCGQTYVIDFQENIQYPKSCPTRKRSIKRDIIQNIVSFRGVAGINKSWWQYDERTSRELEACYKGGERTCELLIAGFLYVADLEAMLQMRRNDHSRRRRIKRDLASVPKKGVAGLRTETDQQSRLYNEYSNSNETLRPHTPTEGSTDNITPVTPSNTPQTPASGRESPHQEDLEATVERIRSLRLDNPDNSTRLRSLNTESSEMDGNTLETVQMINLRSPDTTNGRRVLQAANSSSEDVHPINNSREEFQDGNYSRFQF